MNQMTADNQPLPPVGGDSDQSQVARFRNFLRSTDALTEGSGYINEIRPYDKDPDSRLWFVRVGLVVGTALDDVSQERKPEFQNCDLLIGSTLRRWAEVMHAKGCFSEGSDSLARVRCRFKIRNLRFQPGIHEGKPVLNSRGVLETIEFGWIED